MLINHIECNNVYMTLLVHKKAYRDHFSYYLHLLDFCLLHYLLSSDSKAMAKVSKLHISFIHIYHKN